MKKILLSLGTITLTLVSVAIGSTGAFFSDTETSIGNTFAAGEIDLRVDNTSYYNGVLSEETSWTVRDLTIEKFFNFLDLKPGDFGEDTISLHTGGNDAYLCAEVVLTSNEENGIIEPESGVDLTAGPGEGELAQNINFLWWADDGDNVLEVGENVLPGGPLGSLAIGATTTVALADSGTNIWGAPGPLSGESTHYIGKAWCFGTIAASPEPQDGLGPESPRTPANSTGGITCNGASLGNGTQTDSLTADVSFTSVQSRHNNEFLCSEPEVRIACLEGQEWADVVVNGDQGRRKDGSLILLDRRNPASALGSAETGGGDTDAGFPVGSFYSLGFGVGTTSSRSLSVAFSDNKVVDLPGADLQIFEVTGGAYPDEHVKVEVSQDGVSWFVVAPDAVRDEAVDISSSGLPWIKYVRLTDINSTAPFTNDADGYDVDAVKAINCEQ